jgi:hypothetical protein
MSTHELEFTQQVPMIDSGIANFKAAIFHTLLKSYTKSYGGEIASPLAYCVTYGIFSDRLRHPRRVEEFAQHNAQLVRDEMRKAISNEDVKPAVGLVYAFSLMVMGWRGEIDESNQLVDRANHHDITIPDVIHMWGAEAVVNFFNYGRQCLLGGFTH